MKKIGYIIIIRFFIASISSIYITLEMGRYFEDFNEDNDDEIDDEGLFLANNPNNFEECQIDKKILSIINYQYTSKYNKTS